MKRSFIALVSAFTLTACGNHTPSTMSSSASAEQNEAAVKLAQKIDHEQGYDKPVDEAKYPDAADYSVALTPVIMNKPYYASYEVASVSDCLDMARKHANTDYGNTIPLSLRGTTCMKRDDTVLVEFLCVKGSCSVLPYKPSTSGKSSDQVKRLTRS